MQSHTIDLFSSYLNKLFGPFKFSLLNHLNCTMDVVETTSFPGPFPWPGGGARIVHKLALFAQVLHELFKNDQPINMKDSLADPRAFSHPTQAREKALRTRLVVNTAQTDRIQFYCNPTLSRFNLRRIEPVSFIFKEFYLKYCLFLL